jgi:hypothetical protein
MSRTFLPIAILGLVFCGGEGLALDWDGVVEVKNFGALADDGH